MATEIALITLLLDTHRLFSGFHVGVFPLEENSVSLSRLFPAEGALTSVRPSGGKACSPWLGA